VIGESVDCIIDVFDVDIFFTCTQIMDLANTHRCIGYSKYKDRIKVVSNKTYTYENIAGLLGKLELHIGLRTHTLIFCAAVGTPMINISSYPKSHGFMRTIGQEDRYIAFENLNQNHILSVVKDVWDHRALIRENMQSRVAEEKRKAKASAKLLRKYFA
jgi:polysaccharide pyruvyl transferase WcaK-like protein